MNSTIISACLLTSVCLATFAQTPSLSGRWIVTQDFFGTPRYMRLQLEQNGSKLTGELNGDKLEGTVSDSTIHFVARNEKKDTFEVRGTFAQRILTGTMVATEPLIGTIRTRSHSRQNPLRRWNTAHLSATISPPPCSTDSSPRSTSLF